MRIISGIKRGHIIKAPDGLNTRPTHDRVREAVFSSIGPYFNGEKVLDLFAGSGAMGLEALSRGAGFCIFNDIDRKVITVLKENIKSLQFSDKTRLINNDWSDCLNRIDTKLDLVFLDPPYDLHIIPSVLSELQSRDLLNPNAIIIVETRYGDELLITNSSFVVEKVKKYGIAQINILRLRNENV